MNARHPGAPNWGSAFPSLKNVRNSVRKTFLYALCIPRQLHGLMKLFLSAFFALSLIAPAQVSRRPHVPIHIHEGFVLPSVAGDPNRDLR